MNISTPPKARRATGSAFERLAIDYLSEQGLTLVMQNYYCRCGEIDLVMQDNQTLVFVEVRYRSRSTFVSPLESITTRKQRRLVQTARHFLHRYHLTEKVGCRIDVIGIKGDRPRETITWIRNAIAA